MSVAASLQYHTLQGVKESEEELGRGSYAAVYAVEYKGLTCAAKKFHPTLNKQHYSVRRFQEECAILSRLRHPNIVQFLGVYQQPDSTIPALVMECLPMTLTQCLDQYGVLPNEIGYSILKDVALALSYLHQHDPPIIHRDLSANNVLITHGMTAKISDLGVAKMLDFNPKVMQVMTKGPGNICYMPPEAFEEEAHYDCKLDAFSYGVLMVHLFSGQWPHPTTSVKIDPQDPSRVIPQTEADRRQKTLDAIGRDHPLMNLILSCIHNNPDLRPEAVEILRTVSQVATKFSLTKNLLQQVALLRVDAKTYLQQVHEPMIRSLRERLQEKKEAEIRSLRERLQEEKEAEIRSLRERLQEEKEAEIRSLRERLQEEKEEEIKSLRARLQQEHEAEMRSLRAATEQLQQEHQAEINSKDGVVRNLREKLDHLRTSYSAIVDSGLELQLQDWKRHAQKRPLQLLVCGLVGVGKSTLVNRLLQLKITEVRICGESKAPAVLKYEMRGTKVCFFESPGFDNSDISDEEIVAMIKKETKGKLDLVIYCLSLDHPARVQRADSIAFKVLTKAFGKEIWNRSVFVLTFSNRLGEMLQNAGKYSAVIETIKGKISEALNSSNVSISQLPIVTAGHTDPILKYEEDKSPQAWDDRLFLEMLKRVDLSVLPALFECRWNWADLVAIVRGVGVGDEAVKADALCAGIGGAIFGLLVKSIVKKS